LKLLDELSIDLSASLSYGSSPSNLSNYYLRLEDEGFLISSFEAFLVVAIVRSIPAKPEMSMRYYYSSTIGRATPPVLSSFIAFSYDL
jgi:hypothetical protein